MSNVPLSDDMIEQIVIAYTTTSKSIGAISKEMGVPYMVVRAALLLRGIEVRRGHRNGVSNLTSDVRAKAVSTLKMRGLRNRLARMVQMHGAHVVVNTLNAIIGADDLNDDNTSDAA